MNLEDFRNDKLENQSQCRFNGSKICEQMQISQAKTINLKTSIVFG